MDGFHKVMFKITTNNNDADEAAPEGKFNNVTFMPVLKYKKAKMSKSLSSVFFYQPEMMVSQYVAPNANTDQHFFELS